jgi:hypothetical protein
MHLIQPILIDGTRYCVNQQGNMRTVVLLDGDAAPAGGDTYVIANFGASGSGSIRFGVSCASSVQINLTTDGALVDALWYIRLNGTTIYSGGAVNEALDLTRFIEDPTLIPSPCGNVIEVEAAISSATPSSAVIAAAILFP